MLSKAVRILAIVFVVLVGAAFANTVLAQIKGFTVRVFPKNEEPMIIEEFTWDGAPFIYGEWRGGTIKLGLKDVKEIHFLGDNHNAIVTMNNGA